VQAVTGAAATEVAAIADSNCVSICSALNLSFASLCPLHTSLEHIEFYFFPNFNRMPSDIMLFSLGLF